MPLKTPGERYVPGNIPETPEALIQFLFDELPRISSALNKFPALLVVKQDDLIVPIGLLPQQFPLFVDEPAVQELPSGYWSPSIATWQVPAGGMYQFSLTTSVEAFGAGNKDYFILLGIYLNNNLIWESVSSGADNVPLGASLSLGAILTAGDLITAKITTQHEQFTGDIVVDSIMTIVSTYLE
jgi:hypothetical protein